MVIRVPFSGNPDGTGDSGLTTGTGPATRVTPAARACEITVSIWSSVVRNRSGYRTKMIGRPVS